MRARGRRGASAGRSTHVPQRPPAPPEAPPGRCRECLFHEARDAPALVPGMIRAIFLVRQNNTSHILLAVHRYLTPMTSLPDPLARYPEFGASSWSSETQKEVTIVRGSRKIYHAIYRDWDYKIMVMKPLNRVSNIIWMEDELADLRSFPGLLIVPSYLHGCMDIIYL